MCCNIEKYIEDLSGQNWQKKHFAIEKLSYHVSFKSLKALIQALYDVDSSVRCNVAGVLGKIRDKRSVPFLVELLKDREGEVRLAAIRALGEIGDERAIFPLLNKLRDNYMLVQDITLTQGDYRESSVKGSVIYALQKIGDRSVVPALKRSLKNEKNNIIRALLEDLIEYLGDFIDIELPPIERTSEVLKETPRIKIPDKDSEKKEELEISLPPKAVPQDKEEIKPVRISFKPKSFKDEVKIEEKLEEEKLHVPEETEERMEEKSEVPEEPEERVKIEEKLEITEIKESEEILEDKTESDTVSNPPLCEVEPVLSQETSGYTTRRLPPLPFDPFEEEIMEQICKFESTCMFTRLDGVESLEKIGKPAVKYLLESLKSQNWRIREGTAEALSAIGDTTTLATLKKALPIEPEPSIKECLEKAIKKMEIEIEIRSCIQKLRDNNLFVQLDAIQTLEQIGAPAVVHLVNTLEHEDWKAREGALEVLSVVGDNTILESLKRSLENEQDDYLKKKLQKIIEKLQNAEVE
ncbi:MAG TPA: HEAT repeat domain-containing protein [Candidatus Eremiobacteraeota bacterium]|nr:MAG: putative lyase [bacterium ADurb.Bin363]HPZ09206.1 HEAT repeat domain-containing protein [Candidatus Eremiobacteraeota bacterium]